MTRLKQENKRYYITLPTRTMKRLHHVAIEIPLTESWSNDVGAHIDVALQPYLNTIEMIMDIAKKKKDISPTPFTNTDKDIGNLPLDIFLKQLKEIISHGFKKLRNKRYIVIFTKDFQPTNKYHGMLHYDIISKLIEIEGMIYKGFKIWYDKSVNLYPYGYPYAYVGNQLHQYIIIFRKEIKE